MSGIDIKHMNLYFALLYALLLPFSFLLSPVIALWTLWQLVNYKNVRIKGMFKNAWLVLSVLFFLLHVVAAFFSDNTAEALTSVEIKLSFLFLPVLVFMSDFNSRSVRKIAHYFLLSTTIALVICMLRATYICLTTNKGFITYNDFSWFQHPSYFAMYIVFSIIILVVLSVKFSANKWLHWFMLIFVTGILSSGIFLCASKMGMLTFGVLIPVLLLVMLLKNKQYVATGAATLLMTISGIVLLKADIPAVARLKNAFAFAESTTLIDKTTAESNAVRVLIWGEAIDIIKQNLLIGVSPGDANDRLYKAYEQKGLAGALEKHLNAHNQYLQTALGLGLAGSIILLLITFGAIVYGAIKRNALVVLFGLLVVLNFAVESMLQTQAGTLFYVFFFALLIIPDNTSMQLKKKGYKR